MVYYRDAMTAIARFPLTQKIRVEDAKLTRGVVQAAYKEIKKMGFKGKLTIIDYLCWVSTRWFFTGLSVCVFWRLMEPELDKKKYNLDKIFLKFAQTDDEGVADTRNIIRLWRNNPKMVEDMFNEIVMSDVKVEIEFDLFDTLTKLYKIYLSKESNS
jgi:hypothetical protein